MFSIVVTSTSSEKYAWLFKAAHEVEIFKMWYFIIPDDKTIDALV